MSDALKFWYLFWAYNIIWLLIAAYLMLLGLRQRRLRREIERLKASLRSREEP